MEERHTSAEQQQQSDLTELEEDKAMAVRLGTVVRSLKFEVWSLCMKEDSFVVSEQAKSVAEKQRELAELKEKLSAMKRFYDQVSEQQVLCLCTVFWDIAD